MATKKKKKKFDYFEAFVQLSDYAVDYAEQLVKYLEKNLAIIDEGRDPNIEHAIERLHELHKIEQDADEVHHAVADALSTEFLAPIEREDIMAISDELDDLIDDLDEVLQCMYMYDLHQVNEDIVAMMRLVSKATQKVHDLCVEFPNFKKHGHIRKYVKAINDVEDEADVIFTRAMHDNFVSAKEAGHQSIDAFATAKLLELIEDTCDSCEDIGGTIATVTLKNS